MTCSLLINESPLQILPSLALRVGLGEAIILQQIHYWINPKFNKNLFEGRHWVYNTYDQWQEQFPFWSIKTIKRTIWALEEQGLVHSFITRDFKKMKYYTLDYEALNQQGKNTTVIPSSEGNFLPVRSDRSGPNDPLHRVKLTPFYIQEITHETSSSSLGTDSSDPMETDAESKVCTSVTSISMQRHEDEEEEEIDHEKGKKGKEEEENEDDRMNLPKKMVQIWNERVQSRLYPGQPVALVPKRVEPLTQFLKTELDNDLDRWQALCLKITQIRFLCGANDSGFKVTLDWVLAPLNGRKILEGSIYDRMDRERGLPRFPLQGAAYISRPQDIKPHEISWEDFDQRLDIKLPDDPEDPLRSHWRALSKVLARRIGQSTYTSWFGNVKLVELTPTQITFQAQGPFIRDRIHQSYKLPLQAAIGEVFGHPKTIMFRLSPHEGNSL